MLPNVLDYEPHLALFVPNNDPLIFYKTIADFAIKHLDTNGLLYLEINENLGEETINILKEKGLKNIELRQDLRGKDRMIRSKLN
jgi:release factor glutamine methyltransferase